MRLVTESGLWATGPAVAEAPAVAVLEVSGAVLAWTVDDPAGAEAAHVTFTNVTAAEWLWRLVGSAWTRGTARGAGRGARHTMASLSTSRVSSRRQLCSIHCVGWPSGTGCGGGGRRVPGTASSAWTGPLLDGELALLTVGAQDYFGDDTFDSDVADLLRPHRATLAELTHGE